MTQALFIPLREIPEGKARLEAFKDHEGHAIELSCSVKGYAVTVCCTTCNLYLILIGENA